MKKTLLFTITAAIAIFTLIQSCVKDEYELNEIEWNPNIAIPLVHSKLTLSDILEHVDSTSDIHDHLFEDGTGFLTLIYEGTLFSTTARDLLDTFLIYPSPITLFDIPWSFTDTLPVDSLSLNLELYNKLTSGNFYFHDPKIHVNITNSFGVPIALSFPTLLASSSISTPPTMPVEINGDTAPSIIFANPSPPATAPAPSYPLFLGQTSATSYTFDKTNSNILDFLAISPKYIYYGVIAEMNNPVVTNFVSDTSKFSVNVELELPLYGNASDFMLADTLDFELGFDTDTFVEIEYAIFQLNVDNGMPVDVNIQLDFIDSLAPSVIIESLMDINSEVFSSGIVVNEVVTKPTLRTTTIPVDRPKLDKIGKANKVIIKAKLATANVGPSSGPPPIPLVKFYSTYDLDIKLGVRVQLKTTLN